ncbi:ABC transporter ATP-binding protein/permease [bacterium]|nr:ABC transporter ATP-binding protein/permease [bacterium]
MKNKIKTFLVDLNKVSKLTKTGNKKAVILILAIILNLQIAFDILIILFFSMFFGQQLGLENEILKNILEIKWLFPLFIVFRYLFTYLEIHITTKLRFKIEYNLKKHLMKEVFDKGNYLISDAYFYVNTISEQVGGFYATLAKFIGSLVQIAVFSIYLLTTNLNIFLLFVGGFVIITIPSYFITKFGRKNAHIAYVGADRLSSNLEKVLDNAYLIKILSMVKKEVEKYSSNLTKYYDARLNEINSGTLNHILPVTLTLFVLSLLISLFENLIFITFDFIGVLIRLFQSLGILNKNVHVLSAYHVYLDNLHKIENNRGDKNIENYLSEKENNNYAIVMDDVNFKYFNSDSYIFKNLDLKILRNKHTVITGPNGSGKSTLIGLLTGVLYSESGNVKSYNSRLGYVGAKPMILNSSLRENLLYGSSEDISDEILLKTVKKFKLFENEEEYNLNSKISNKNLSAGQMQKISFARAMLNNINVLVLDESTANLDKDSKIQIYKILSNLKITVINSTHSIDELNDYDVHLKIEFDENNKKILKKV